MSGVTTHVLDTSIGLPAAGVTVVLERSGEAGAWVALGRGETDQDGRVGGLVADVTAGTYRLVFDTRAYFAARRVDSFFPSVTIVFSVAEPHAHYHVPLLLSPFGYTTYRGS
ncbi:MAG TPA: hydroxyisourate hydrolase [Vicinamibacterales bacterium]|nr:hydroxyisourate hydrolase [Vicinamibacterales bacterium]